MVMVVLIRQTVDDGVVVDALQCACFVMVDEYDCEMMMMTMKRHHRRDERPIFERGFAAP